MRLTLTPSHHTYFLKKGSIEFEGLLNPASLEEAHQAALSLLHKRTKKLPSTQTPAELYRAGRDLFRESPLLFDLATNKNLAQMASLLFDEGVIRLGCDQALATFENGALLFNHQENLEEITSLQPLLGGALLKLSGADLDTEEIPRKVGNVTFFTAKKPLPWSLITQEKNTFYLLITYLPLKGLYVLNKRDVHTHAPKKLGYGSGDSLTEETHPILYRKN